MIKHYIINKDNSNIIFRMPDGGFIPKDKKNSDYINFLEWSKTNVSYQAESPDAARKNYEALALGVKPTLY